MYSYGCFDVLMIRMGIDFENIMAEEAIDFLYMRSLLLGTVSSFFCSLEQCVALLVCIVFISCL